MVFQLLLSYSDSLRVERIGVRTPADARHFLFSNARTDWLLSPASMLHQGYCVSYPALKWFGCGVDHPFKFSAAVKNAEDRSSTSPL